MGSRKNNLQADVANAQRLFYTGHRIAAIEQLDRLHRRHPDVLPLKRLLGHVIAEAGVDVPTSARFKEVLIMCLDEHLGDVRRLLVAAAPVFNSDGPFNGALDMFSNDSLEVNCNALLKGWHLPVTQNPLLMSVLRNVILTNREYERALTQIRKTIIHSLAGDSGKLNLDRTIGTEFCSSLAMQCWLNEYVHTIGEDEQQLLCELREEAERSIVNTDRWTSHLEALLLVVALYQPLHELEVAPQTWKKMENVWPASLRPLVTEVNRYFEEQDIKHHITSFATIENQVSVAVSAQYEDNPYPRWSSLPEVKRVSFGDWLLSNQTHFRPPEFLFNPVRLLVAGCGTGRELIWLHSSLRTREIMAVDLSRSSLAYAIRKSRERNLVEDIEFWHGDILQLHQLPDQKKGFEVIACSGVLHHMEEPMQGWRILVDLLRSGGVIKVGLYSELARRVVARARQQIKRLGIRPTRDSIRAFRQDLFLGNYPGLMALTTHPDMYSTSMCRDLLFHEQEWRFNIQDIKKMLNRLNLEFIGFEGVEEAKQQYALMFPEGHELNNLDNWSAFEDQYPDTFKSMYLIIAQKR